MEQIFVTCKNCEGGWFLHGDTSNLAPMSEGGRKYNASPFLLRLFFAMVSLNRKPRRYYQQANQKMRTVESYRPLLQCFERLYGERSFDSMKSDELYQFLEHMTPQVTG